VQTELIKSIPEDRRVKRHSNTEQFALFNLVAATTKLYGNWNKQHERNCWSIFIM